MARWGHRDDTSAFFFFFFRSQSRLGQTVPQQTLKTPMAKEMMREINGFR